MATAYRDSATRSSPQTTVGGKKSLIKMGVKFFAKKIRVKFLRKKLGVNFFWNLTTNDVAGNLE